MLRTYTVSFLVLFLSFIFCSNAIAQDAKKDAKKETKPAVVDQTKKDSKVTTATEQKKAKKSTKSATMKFVSCSQPGCGLWAKSHSARELRYFVKRHAKRYHKTVLTTEQAKGMVKVEGAK